MNNEKSGIPALKSTMLLIAWITAIMIIAGACWIFTQPVRQRFLIRSVNRVLEQSGDKRRLGEQFNSGPIGSLIMGSWYPVTSGEDQTKAFVFSFIGEGTFFPCAAIVDKEGKVQEFIPLNSHGSRVLKSISPGIIKLYTKRIEGAGS